jgi:hypothetical protein
MTANSNPTSDQPATAPEQDRRRARLALSVQDAASYAVTVLINDRYGADLPALIWRPITRPTSTAVESLSGQVPADRPGPAAVTVLQAWADQYDLQPADDPLPGTTELRGHIDTLPAEIWAVTDRAAFEAPAQGSGPR